ncbi:hypothetical protein DAPPUDRAFT_239171 [Daphnia pulex]|uniref:Uncharacterized protein n=1 Tax=Daphnia pulex TaxID=6669 RepID=E9G8J1_DAPPU|nr:hypothetical protein DAPPUDRAFT_239171 [Daphnia pulex]|eukprot:EFX83982.1 hypothetical protein DAPPUDRAFT_239171 [Daphnia pulex]
MYWRSPLVMVHDLHEGRAPDEGKDWDGFPCRFVNTSYKRGGSEVAKGLAVEINPYFTLFAVMPMRTGAAGAK